jgi:uncharacterized Fe-S cluster-containing protein
MSSPNNPALPGLNCGLCGYRTCAEFAGRLEQEPAMIKRCLYSSAEAIGTAPSSPSAASRAARSTGGVVTRPPAAGRAVRPEPYVPPEEWHDSLGREFDFYLEHFPEDRGPREVILPHNPMLTREMDMKPGDIMIGRPLGMSCGCPVTHCGVVMDVDGRTGVMTWCVTGPLDPREKGFKDVGYYTAEAYEGLIRGARCEIKIGARYFFQPRMCMLQWRHSGLVNYLNRTSEGLQVRLEGLWIG